MGINNLWTILAPYAELKPIGILRNKRIAIDLPSLLTESMGNIDATSPLDQHLRNLYFRVTFLLMERITPIFFLGNEDFELAQTPSQHTQPNGKESSKYKLYRKMEFPEVLQKCLQMLNILNVQIITIPGAAIHCCTYLLRDGYVDGIISNNSDCVAYGAPSVYKNMTLSCGEDMSKFTGHLEYYNLEKICQKHEIGQNKAIVMALLYGCDLCPRGVVKTTNDSVIQFISLYSEKNILEHICNWHRNDQYSYWRNAIADVNICGECGHIGGMMYHKKYGCGICNTQQGCITSAWKNLRFNMLLELIIRKEALQDPLFPNENIIMKYLKTPFLMPYINDTVCRPNLLLFVSYMSTLLKWSKSFSFCKFFPLLTRTHVWNALRNTPSSITHVTPKKIIKKKTIMGEPHLLVLWRDKNGVLQNLIPNIEVPPIIARNENAFCYLWTTFEPLDMMMATYPTMVRSYLSNLRKVTWENVPLNITDRNGAGDALECNFKQNYKETNAVSFNISASKRNIVKKYGIKKRQLSESQIEEIAEDFLKLYISKKQESGIDDEEEENDSGLIRKSALVHLFLIRRKQFICYGPTPDYNVAHLVEKNRICCQKSIIKRGKIIDDLDIFMEKRRIKLFFLKSVLFCEKTYCLDDCYNQMWLKLGWDPESFLSIITKQAINPKATHMKELNLPQIRANVKVKKHNANRPVMVSELFVPAYNTVHKRDVFDIYIEQNLYARDLLISGHGSCRIHKVSLTAEPINQN